MEPSIEKRVTQQVASMLGFSEAEVTLDSNLVNDLGADSLDLVELIMAIEEEFDLEIEDEAAEKCQTVQDIFDLVSKLLSDAAGN